MPLSHYELNLGQSFNSLIPTSPISVLTLNILTLFRSSNSDNIKYPLPSTALPSFLSADNTPNSSTFIHI